MTQYPVLLVHGIDDTHRRFQQMQAALLGRSFGIVRAMDLLPPDASISLAQMGQQVGVAVQGLQQDTHAVQIDIVAFSMGTLAVRHFLQRQGGYAHIRRFISISGPHHGTLMAHLRQNVGSRQMRPGSACLRALNADPELWRGVAVFSFWSPLDLMVLPATSSRLPQAQNRAFCVGLHPWMVTDRRVIEAVVQTLSRPD